MKANFILGIVGYELVFTRGIFCGQCSRSGDLEAGPIGVCLAHLSDDLLSLAFWRT